MRLQKKNQYLIAGRPPKGFFFYNKIGIKKLHSVRRLLDGEMGSERMKKEKAVSSKRNSLCIVAEARLELTTFGL